MGDYGHPPRRRRGARRSPTSRPSAASWTTGTCSTTSLRSQPRRRRRRRGTRRDRLPVADEAQGRHRDDRRQHGDLPRRRRQDHRGLELWLQARGLAVTERVLDELGYYLLAGAGGEGPADVDGRGPARRGTGLRHGVHLRAVERQGGVLARRRGVRGHQPDADRHRRNQSQHPPSADHRLVGDHHAPAVEVDGSRSASAAAWRPCTALSACQPVTTAQMEDFAQVMRRLWHGEVIFNHDGPIGKYQVLFLDPDFNEDIRLALVAFGPKTLGSGRPRVRRRHPAHLLHPGDPAAVREDGEGRRREGRPRPDERPGVVVFRDRRRPPARGTAAEEDRGAAGHLSAGLWGS